ncbi:MAG: efflux RND transporter periplasmic adaptor subunit [Filimonas sp.]|nr:efflux RND transporter periplasmic adaptor subunit [Filimonas sp.]
MKKIIYIASLMLLFAACKNQQQKHAHDHDSAKVDTAKSVLYTCTMDPEVISDKPGSCPVCGMKLVPMENKADKPEDITLESLLKPTNQFVVSSIPVTTIKKRQESIVIKALGKIAYDTREERSVAARISGRIEKLYVRYRFQHVHKGQKLMEIYSPEIAAAQQNLLFLLKSDGGNTALIDAAKQRLLLLGMDSEQLNGVIASQKILPAIAVYSAYTGHIHEAGGAGMQQAAGTAMKDVSLLTEELPLKEGMYVQKGQAVFSIYNSDKVWALLNIYAADQSLIKKGDVVLITPETAPGKQVNGRIDFIEPFYKKDSKTVTARVYLNNSANQIPIGSQVNATITAGTKDAEWLPVESVLSLGLDKVVFVKTTGGFRAHKVVTGIAHNGHIQILSGLQDTEEVAVNAQYLMDSESFIKVNE